ncbi:phosphotransferase [Actinomadura rupiterrae]|uniref:phosphotransferase n=1 Tax=Actinomadura rupiterrae TaxID=559627 RepID=UPI0020A427E6|nr:phosphotransferase [Actinomadura rupiterrae]MCP2340017.1 hypothetical protein [Actinomadura rupiterrae]
MDEQALPGGKTTGTVRVGDTVRRTAQPWTPSVQALLRHLEAAGFDGAPRVLGFDDQGREVLTFMEGDVVGDARPWPAWAVSDESLAQAGAWARRLHDLTAEFVPPPDAPWFTGRPWQPGLIIAHNDAAPYNAVWRDGRLAGFVDWDTAGPTTRAFELAWMALTWVPLNTRSYADVFDPGDEADRSRRLHVLLDGYGYDGDRTALPEVIARRARINAQVIRQIASGGDPVYKALLPFADDQDQAAEDALALPASFWRP